MLLLLLLGAKIAVNNGQKTAANNVFSTSDTSNTIITSHYYLIKIIPTKTKDSIFLNMCEKLKVKEYKMSKGVHVN